MQELFKKFLRMEIDFDTLKKEVPLNFDGSDDYEYVKREYSIDGESATIYKPDIDDFIVAATNAQLSDNPEEKFTYWFAVLYGALFNFYGFDKYLEVYGDFIILIPKDEDEAVWHVFQLIKFQYFKDNNMSANEVMVAVIQAGETYKMNRFKDEDEFQLTDDQIKGTISLYANDEAIEAMDNDFKKVFTNTVEEGCERDLAEALNFKAYSLYLGNKIYKQNRRESRDLMEKLYKMTNDPDFANTLGYIYYYGFDNCKPDYEKAFAYFTMGHLEGNFESTYKLADMLVKGKGVISNPEKGVRLVLGIYHENFERFCYGDFGVHLADVAYRVAGYFEEGIGFEKSIIEAYRYYLIASYAIEKRIENLNIVWDDEIRQNIGQALTRVKKQLEELPESERVFCDEAEYEYMPMVPHLLDGSSYILLKVSKYSESEVRLDVKAYRKIGDEELTSRNYLWAEPVFDEYRFGNEFTLFAQGKFDEIIGLLDDDIEINNNEFAVLADAVELIQPDDMYEPQLEDNMSFDDTLQYAKELLSYNNRPRELNPVGYIFTQNNHVEFRLDSRSFVIKKEFF